MAHMLMREVKIELPADVVAFIEEKTGLGAGDAVKRIVIYHVESFNSSLIQ